MSIHRAVCTQAGEIDWTDSVPTQRVDELRGDDSITLGVTPATTTVPSTDEARKPWNDVRVCQAIAYRIDRQAIVQATSYGTAVANQLAIPKGNPWYVDYQRYSRNLETAKTLLGQAGVKDRQWICLRRVTIQRR